MRSYQQLHESFEYLEELWIYLHESIFGQKLAGRFHFDRVWKDLFLERILDSRFLKHFLNDVSDQEANLLRSQKYDSRGKSRFILDELYHQYSGCRICR